jgi:hypothetical protein
MARRVDIVLEEILEAITLVEGAVSSKELSTLPTAIAAMLLERRVELTADLPNAEIDAVEVAQMAPGLSHLNAELDEKR